MSNAVRTARKKGYVVTSDGDVISPLGRNRKLNASQPGGSNRQPYWRFNIVDARGIRVPVPVHLLAAYQKFGERVFMPETQVRHLDGNSLNNTLENIAIGTPSENQMDKPKHTRIRVAKKAASKNKRLSEKQEEELKTLRSKGWTYKKLAKHFGIAVGTAHRTLNKP